MRASRDARALVSRCSWARMASRYGTWHAALDAGADGRPCWATSCGRRKRFAYSGCPGRVGVSLEPSSDGVIARPGAPGGAYKCRRVPGADEVDVCARWPPCPTSGTWRGQTGRVEPTFNGYAIACRSSRRGSAIRCSCGRWIACSSSPGWPVGPERNYRSPPSRDVRRDRVSGELQGRNDPGQPGLGTGRMSGMRAGALSGCVRVPRVLRCETIAAGACASSPLVCGLISGGSVQAGWISSPRCWDRAE